MPAARRKSRVIRSQKEIRALIREFEDSGLNQSEFARSKNINIAVFGRWVRGARKANTSAEVNAARRIVPVHIDSPARKSTPDGEGSIELVLPGGVLIRIHKGFDHVTLLELLRCLEIRC